MNPVIKVVDESQLPVIERLNNDGIPYVNQLDQPDLRWFLGVAPYFRAALIDQKIAGFVIAVPSQLSYSSHYYGWFNERYTNFLYIDRIVIARWARRQGIGRMLYKDVENFAARLQKVLVADVYSVPLNQGSLAFHHDFGFEEVGRQEVENGTKTVVKLMKPPRLPDDGLKTDNKETIDYV
jgi:predicted GNAT superfamily acetyltransferase